MTSYGYDEARCEVVATRWAHGGPAAHSVGVAPEGAETATMRRLAHCLGLLSSALWCDYSEAGETLDASGGEGSRRSRVLAGLSSPHLYTDGMLITPYDPAEAWSHVVGRVLVELGDEALSRAVIGEVGGELDAVGDACLGRLEGRSAQASRLTRRVPLPAHVRSAHQILHDDPLGSLARFEELDPTSASVAAAAWLHAAAVLAADSAGVGVTQVVAEADNISALPVGTPTAVLEALEDGCDAVEAVVGLVCDALAVASGGFTDAEELAELAGCAVASARRWGADPHGVVLCELDPKRPGPDLLEDLVLAIEGCWLLWEDYQALDWEFDDEASEEQHDAQRQERSAAAFADLVRTEYAALYTDELWGL